MDKDAELVSAHTSLNNIDLFLDMSEGMIRALRARSGESPEQLQDPQTGETWPASIVAKAFENIVTEKRERVARLRAELAPPPPGSGVEKGKYVPGAIAFDEIHAVPEEAGRVWSQRSENSARLAGMMEGEEARRAYEEGLAAGQSGEPREDNPYGFDGSAEMIVHLSWEDGWTAGSEGGV